MRHCLYLLLLVFSLLPAAPSQAHILDLGHDRYVDFESMLDDLERQDVVFVGELHDRKSHHDAQLAVIKGLVERGHKVAVGLEMFRANGQASLDDWTRGLLEEGVFRAIYNDHWSMWPVYEPIFTYARQQEVPLVGLNIDREITRQISVEGFASLSAEQLAELEGVTCDVDERYQAYIRKALGRHSVDDRSFASFCEAQMVWDNVMAINLLKWHQRHPETIIVVLAGSGHAWRYGIPEQLRRRSDLNYKILLPEVEGRTDRSNTSEDEADYLLLGLDQGPLH